MGTLPEESEFTFIVMESLKTLAGNMFSLAIIFMNLLVA